MHNPWVEPVVESAACLGHSECLLGDVSGVLMVLPCHSPMTFQLQVHLGGIVSLNFGTEIVLCENRSGSLFGGKVNVCNRTCD